METLTLNKKFPGLKIYCNSCKKERDTICSKHSLDLQCYKVRVYIPGTRKKQTKCLIALHEDAAIKEAIIFKEEVTGIVSKEMGQKIQAEKTEAKISGPTLMDGIKLYMNYLNNVDVPLYEQCFRTKDHVDDVCNILMFMENAVSLSIPITEFTSETVGEIYRCLLAKKGKQKERISVRTYNKYISCYKTFFNFLIEKKYPVENYFLRIELRSSRKKPLMITAQEYYQVLEKVRNGNHVYSYECLSKSKKTHFTKNVNMYRPWLIPAFELALLGGGRRREEVICLKWTQVIDYKGQLIGGVIQYHDLKVERQKNVFFADEMLPIEVPITPQLADLLLRLGWEQNNGLDLYIIGPDCVDSRTLMMDQMSKAFAHYYRQIENARPGITFKNLRKTYISYIRNILGRDAKAISGHSTDGVIERHYEDTTFIRAKLIEQLKF